MVQRHITLNLNLYSSVWVISTNLTLQGLDFKYLCEVTNLWKHLLPTASKIIVPVKQISVFWQLNKTRTRYFSKYSQNNLSVIKWLSHYSCIRSDLSSLDLNSSLEVIKIKDWLIYKYIFQSDKRIILNKFLF